MADTTAQLEIEEWIRNEWLPRQYGQRFNKGNLKLSSGGFFEFDAVSEDEKVVVTISTSRAKTVRGRGGAGKIQKIRADMFFLLLAEAELRSVVLTEPDMLEFWQKEKVNGRVPDSITFISVSLPPELMTRLQNARAAAEKEVSPRQQE